MSKYIKAYIPANKIILWLRCGTPGAVFGERRIDCSLRTNEILMKKRRRQQTRSFIGQGVSRDPLQRCMRPFI